MPVNTPRAEYTRALEKWGRCRDCFDGSDAVKEQGTKYLPEIDERAYKNYLLRAEFYNATARTVMGLLGCVFRTRPTVRFPDQLLPDLDDVTLTAKPLEALALQGFQETLLLGRWGVQVEMTDVPPPGMTTPRPYWVPRRAEDIVSWKTVVMGGQERLARVVFLEQVQEPDPDDPWVDAAVHQCRVLELVGAETGDPIYTIQRYREARDARGSVKQGAWEPQGEPFVPLRRGKPLRFIPFQFFGPSALGSEIQKPPLLDLVDVNLSHYRTSADHEHGAHMTSLPTPWVSGVEVGESLPIGSSTAWVLPEPGSRAGMLEYTGDGLGSLERLMAAKQERMAALGARIIEPQKRAAETAEALRIRSAAEYSVLSTLALTFDMGIMQLMKMHAWWAGVDDTSELVGFALNKDYFDTRLPAQDFQAMVAAWQAGAISHDTLFWNMQQGELIEPGRTLPAEQELINAGLGDPGSALVNLDKQEEQ